MWYWILALSDLFKKTALPNPRLTDFVFIAQRTSPICPVHSYFRKRASVGQTGPPLYAVFWNPDIGIWKFLSHLSREWFLLCDLHSPRPPIQFLSLMIYSKSTNAAAGGFQALSFIQCLLSPAVRWEMELGYQEERVLCLKQPAA